MGPMLYILVALPCTVGAITLAIIHIYRHLLNHTEPTFQRYIVQIIFMVPHNGELKGGAKASQAGMPWICACLIQGFRNKNTACKVESKWKSFSRKVPWRRSENTERADDAKLFLLQRRHAALNQVKDSMDFSDLEIHWHLDLVPV